MIGKVSNFDNSMPKDTWFHTVVKWVSIIWLFGKKNNASKKIWEFVVPEIFRILVNEPSKLAQKKCHFVLARHFCLVSKLCIVVPATENIKCSHKA